ncbi:MAG: acetylornithine deacetylase [Hyphomicrobiales bacterium]|nr:acetylornithine deacetylase [Hyphomicrobiales bacterium]MBV8664152.1 acetylornithine deacetylase [Hyphomicrobiales bacterium]
MSADIEARVRTILQRLIAFDTVSDRSNLALIDYVEDYLRTLGAPTWRVANGAGDMAALMATIGPEVEGGAVLSGHTDTVPVVGQAWSGDPFALREVDGRLYGRGACDMKGFGAIALAMVPYFQAAGLKRPIHILLSYDEETTCLGSLDLIARFGRETPRPALAIIGEPTMMGVADAHKGVATFRTIVTGHEAHSSKPALGASAVAVACDIVSEIGRLARVFEAPDLLDPRFDPPYSTFHVGVIHGGTARNILARECTFDWEFRGLPGFPSAKAAAMVQAFVDEVALPRLTRFVSGPKIETILDVDVPGLAAKGNEAAATLALRLTRSNQLTAVSFATEAGHFQQAGLPTVVCGPGSIDQAHKPDEYIAAAQVSAGIAFMKGLAEELAR